MSDGAKIQEVHVRANEKNTIAKLTIAFYVEKPKHIEKPEALFQLTNPVGQTCCMYVSADDKARVIAEMRAALTAWEKAP